MKLNRDFLAQVAGVRRFDDAVIRKLESYADSLIAANQKINLISRSVEITKEIENQIALSLILLRLIESRPATWIDIGSGGGFPVVPMAIVFDTTTFTAVEPVAKKAYFLERTSQSLEFSNISVEAKRIEEVFVGPLDRVWDVVTLKAVTDLDKSLHWASKLLGSNGKLITYKPKDSVEVEDDHGALYGLELLESLYVKDFIDSIDLNVIVYRKS